MLPSLILTTVTLRSSSKYRRKPVNLTGFDAIYFENSRDKEGLWVSQSIRRSILTAIKNNKNYKLNKCIYSRGGTPGNSWWRCPYFRPKNVIFHTRFQTWRWSQNATLHVYIKQKLCYHCWDWNLNEKNFLKSISHITLSYSYGIETTHIDKQP